MTKALGIDRFRSHGHSTHSFGGTFGSAAAAGALCGLKADGVRYFSGVKAVDITSPAGAPVQADGDFAGHVPVAIRAAAGTVHVVC